jgi:hypothetical protein
MIMTMIVLIELDELNDEEWVERARWITGIVIMSMIVP